MSPESQLSPLKRHRYWLWFSVAYGVCLGTAFVWLNSDLNTIAFSVILGFAYCLALATTVMVGAWSVLGPGPLLKRAAWSNLLGLLVLLGLMIAFCFQGDTSREEPWFMSLLFLIGFVCLSTSAQIMFWLLRGIFGWQLVFRDSSPRASLSLSEIFVIIFMFAALSATPNLIANVFAQQEVASLKVGDISYNQVPQPNGLNLTEEELVTEENIADIRQRKTEEASSQAIVSVLAMIAYGSISGLMATPIFWFMFRAKSIRQGWIRSFLFGPAVVVLVGMTLMVTFEGISFFTFETLFGLLFGGLFFACALAWPLAVSRKVGYRLITKRTAMHMNAITSESV